MGRRQGNRSSTTNGEHTNSQEAPRTESAEVRQSAGVPTPELQEAANRTRMRVTSHPSAGPRDFKPAGNRDENAG